jgi:hypothetical protein
MNKKINFILTFIFSLMLATVPPNIFAQTPDGETPHMEEQCDVLLDATKGLYGLCIAYCEAQDAPTDLSSQEKFENLPIPNKKILANYDKKKKETDPNMPCVSYADDSACPAWTYDQLELVGLYGYPNRRNDWSIYAEGPLGQYESNFYDHEWLSVSGIAYKNISAQVRTTFNEFSGQYEYTGVWHNYIKDLDTNEVTVNEIYFTDLTEGQAEACTDEIIEHDMDM